MTEHATCPPYPLNQVRFAKSALAHQGDVVAAGDELATGQFFKRDARDRLGIEGPIERFQRCRTGELGQTQSALDRSLTSEDRRARKKAF